MALGGLKCLENPTVSLQGWLLGADHQPMDIVKCNSGSQRKFSHYNDLPDFFPTNLISHSWNHSELQAGLACGSGQCFSSVVPRTEAATAPGNLLVK